MVVAPARSADTARTGPARADVEAYWERAHDAYLTDVGTTFQAGCMTPGRSMCESNVWLAKAAGLEAGQLVLDAGCGVCGPAIDMARAVEGLRIVGLTLSRRQAAAAATLIAEAGLGGRLHVIHGDYRALPFAKGTFDTVLFLESIGYAAGIGELLDGVRRVLKPRGVVYVKDVFRYERLWCDQEREELAEFDRVYAQQTPFLTECIDAAVGAGFTDVRTRDLSGVVCTAGAHRVMFDRAGGHTSFGRLHYRRQDCLPVYFADLTARAPA